MRYMSSGARTTLIVFCLGSLIGTAAVASKLSSKSDEKADFSSFATYAWREVEDSSAPPGLDRDIRSAANEVLAKKGLREVDPGRESPDLLFEYAVGAVDQLQAGGFRVWPGWWGDLYLVPGAYSTVQAGILVLAAPSGSDKAVWAGMVVMRGNAPNALQVMRGRAAKEVKKIVKTYPGRD